MCSKSDFRLSHFSSFLPVNFTNMYKEATEEWKRRWRRFMLSLLWGGRVAAGWTDRWRQTEGERCISCGLLVPPRAALRPAVSQLSGRWVRADTSVWHPGIRWRGGDDSVTQEVTPEGERCFSASFTSCEKLPESEQFRQQGRAVCTSSHRTVQTHINELH